MKRINPSICILEKICSVYNLSLSDLFELDEYHESMIGLKEELKVYQLLLKKVLQLYNIKEKNLICEYNKKT